MSGQGHVNSMKSFGAELQRGYRDAHHHMGAEPPDPYVAEFARGHDRRPRDVDAIMARAAEGMGAERLLYAEVVAA